ncbi:MAG: LemA family protein [Eubacteriales bacterium]|nr:LemA family protein [Eubacteriales bacterium]
MKKGLIAFIVIIAAVLIIVLSAVGSYNGLVTKSEEVETAFSQISTQLQRRNDLIPNIVATVQGYAAHEAEVFIAIAEARSALAGAQSNAEMAAADDAMNSALARLLVIIENYPELKANTQFTALTDELAGTENRIANARMEYNNVAKDYNTKIRRFPTNIMAALFNFDKADYFEAAEGSEVAPTVSFPQ